MTRGEPSRHRDTRRRLAFAILDVRDCYWTDRRGVEHSPAGGVDLILEAYDVSAGYADKCAEEFFEEWNSTWRETDEE